MPNGWTRVDHVRRVPAGLAVDFSVHHGRRGKSLGRWTVTCRGIHEVKISDLDGGGLAVYPSSHPAARQYVASFARLRWPRKGNTPRVLAALQQAHVKAVDDWIPFDRYLQINTPYTLPYFAPVSGDNFFCKGPDFLLRVYANALSARAAGAVAPWQTKPPSTAAASFALRFVLHRCRPLHGRMAIGPVQFQMRAAKWAFLPLAPVKRTGKGHQPLCSGCAAVLG